mgnify:CR=1 FL=1
MLEVNGLEQKKSINYNNSHLTLPNFKNLIVEYKGFKGDKIWTSLSQLAYNLHKFIQLDRNEKIEEESLVKLGLYG